MTPQELIHSWNALSRVLNISENMTSEEFTTQAKRIIGNYEIRNEIEYWNNLTEKERTYLNEQGKEIDLDFKKIDVPPKAYQNSDIDDLQRFFSVELEPQKTKIEQLLEGKDDD
jgi:hypothetical protein